MKRRNTIQRSLVLDAVNRLQNHATADEIYTLIAMDHPSISRATVYRNLNQLAEGGEIRRLEALGGPDRYDHLCYEHYHARCLRCGRVFDMEMDYIADLDKSIRDKHGFQIIGHDIMFRGLCPQCQQEPELASARAQSAPQQIDERR